MSMYTFNLLRGRGSRLPLVDEELDERKEDYGVEWGVIVEGIARKRGLPE